MSKEKLKALWKLLTTKGQWVLPIVTILLAVYYFGAFGNLATGYLWYDLRRLLLWLYNSIIVPTSLVYAGFSLFRGILKLLPEEETDFPQYVRDLRHQCYRFDNRLGDLAGTTQNLLSRVQKLEAKTQVICSLLRTPEAEKISTNVLEEA